MAAKAGRLARGRFRGGAWTDEGQRRGALVADALQRFPADEVDRSVELHQPVEPRFERVHRERDVTPMAESEDAGFDATNVGRALTAMSYSLPVSSTSCQSFSACVVSQRRIS